MLLEYLMKTALCAHVVWCLIHSRWGLLKMYQLPVMLGVSDQGVLADLPLEVLTILELLDTLDKELVVTCLLMCLDHIRVLLLGRDLHREVVPQLLLTSCFVQFRLLDLQLVLVGIMQTEGVP